MEQETITGFQIALRELTQEEASREITLDRFSEFHYLVGEDFCDLCGSFISHKVLAGYLIAKHPEFAPEYLDVCNDKYGEAIDLMLDSDKDDEFYSDLAELANLTVNLKKNINQVLIQVAEYYGNE